MNQKRFTIIVLGIIIVVLVGAVGYLAFNNQKTPVSAPAPGSNETSSSTPGPKNNSKTVSLRQRFTLKKNQFAKIADTGLEIGIIQFYNSPCPGPNDPEGTVCDWSGVGIEFEYRFNGEVLSGINRTSAFDYQTTIVKTDHETYASLVVEKMK